MASFLAICMLISFLQAVSGAAVHQSACICQVPVGEVQECVLMNGVYKDEHFVTAVTHIMDFKIPMNSVHLYPGHFCRGKVRNKRVFLDLGVIGLDIKHDCNGITVSGHAGIPGVANGKIGVHTGTDGVDLQAKGDLDGVQLGLHAGLDGSGSPEGGGSAGVGIGDYAGANVHVNADKGGTKVGAAVDGEIPGLGSASASVDHNLNTGKTSVSGEVVGAEGGCIHGEKDVTKQVNEFMKQMGQHGMQNAVKDHIAQHGDSGTGFNPSSFMGQAGMQQFQQNMQAQGMGSGSFVGK